MKGIEIVVLAGIITIENSVSFQAMGEKLLLSPSQVYYAVSSLEKKGLIYQNPVADERQSKLLKYKAYSAACHEFLVHGLKYVFPFELGTPVFGIETLSTDLINDREKLLSDKKVVWQHAEGKTSGISLKPIHKNVPLISIQNQKIYHFFVVLDFLRSRNSRDNAFGNRMLKKILEAPHV